MSWLLLKCVEFVRLLISSKDYCYQLWHCKGVHTRKVSYRPPFSFGTNHRAGVKRKRDLAETCQKITVFDKKLPNFTIFDMFPRNCRKPVSWRIREISVPLGGRKKCVIFGMFPRNFRKPVSWRIREISVPLGGRTVTHFTSVNALTQNSEFLENMKS